MVFLSRRKSRLSLKPKGVILDAKNTSSNSLLSIFFTTLREKKDNCIRNIAPALKLWKIAKKMMLLLFIVQIQLMVVLVGRIGQISIGKKHGIIPVHMLIYTKLEKLTGTIFSWWYQC
jgi:hypothetical protein